MFWLYHSGFESTDMWLRILRRKKDIEKKEEERKRGINDKGGR
jgi:hypothetical protein